MKSDGSVLNRIIIFKNLCARKINKYCGRRLNEDRDQRQRGQLGQCFSTLAACYNYLGTLKEY